MIPTKLLPAFALSILAALALASLAAAHGGAHKKPEEAQTAPAPAADAPSPYALEPTPEETPLDDDLLSPFARGVMEDHEMEEGMGNAMDGHAMPEVELSHHTLVSPSKPGYPWAVAVTALSGLLFGVLAIRRR
jgi:hypothetical protein